MPTSFSRMIPVTGNLSLSEEAIEERFIRSPRPGGQNVNKVATAVQIRFDARAGLDVSPAAFQRLQTLCGQRMTAAGVIVLTANRFRSQLKNRQDAKQRLVALIRQALITPKRRRPGKPSRAAQERRLVRKKRQGQQKAQRRLSRKDIL